MDFLQYIELSAENLQFYLWYQDYVKRFDALPGQEKALSPQWTADRADLDALATKKEKRHSKTSADAAAILKGTDFEKNKAAVTEHSNPFHTPPRTPVGDRESMAPSTADWSEDGSTLRSGTNTHAKKAATAFEEAEAFQPCELDLRSLFRIKLTFQSYHPAIPRRDLPHHRNLHCRWWSARTQSLCEGEDCSAQSFVHHHSPFRIP